MLFDGWSSLGRVLAMCVLGYAVVVVVIRLSGKRSLSKMNAFDFVINVSLGSMLAMLVLSDRVSFVNGAAALVTLTMLQFGLSWLSVRSSLVRAAVHGQPALLYFRGDYHLENMRRERVTRDEIRAAVRQQGINDIEDVEAVILEVSGDLAVVRRDPDGVSHSSIDEVSRPHARSADVDA